MLSLNKYSHFLMNYDGLIVDSEKLYFETWCRVLNEEGQKVCQRCHEGKHESEVYERVRLYLRQDMTLEEISKYRASMFDELVAKGQLELVEGVKGLLGKLQSIAPMSIVSNSVKDIVEDGIRSTGIEGYFNNLFCFSDKVRRKPSPDIYNLAVSKLNLKKNSILAFEDSDSGVIAARKAGVPVICISSNTLMEDFCKKNYQEYFRSAYDLLLSF